MSAILGTASITATDLTALFIFTSGMLITFFSWVVRKLANHDSALAVLIQQVNPPGDKSLRELLHDIQLEQVKTTVKEKGE